MRRILHYLWLISLICVIGLYLYPLRNTIIRTWFLGSVVAFYSVTFLRAFRLRPLRISLLSLPLLIVMLICVWPDRSYSTTDLRDSYLSALRSYHGVRYYWGGENHLGIDCSGLPRAALIQSSFLTGLRTGNPALLRRATWYWWNDASARELAAGYRGNTIPLGTAANLRDYTQAPLSVIEPGDLAIVDGGTHVLCYLGDHSWIEADPVSLHVKIWNQPTVPVTTPVTPKADVFPWLDQPAELVRWQCFSR